MPLTRERQVEGFVLPTSVTDAAPAHHDLGAEHARLDRLSGCGRIHLIGGLEGDLASVKGLWFERSCHLSLVAQSESRFTKERCRSIMACH